MIVLAGWLAGCGTHESVALSSAGGTDQCMPTNATDGFPAPTADQAQLFPAYVQAFCLLGAP